MEKYEIKGSKKDTFLGEYKPLHISVSKEELIELLKSPLVIIDKVIRKSTI